MCCNACEDGETINSVQPGNASTTHTHAHFTYGVLLPRRRRRRRRCTRATYLYHFFLSAAAAAAVLLYLSTPALMVADGATTILGQIFVCDFARLSVQYTCYRILCVKISLAVMYDDSAAKQRECPLELAPSASAASASRSRAAFKMDNCDEIYIALSRGLVGMWNADVSEMTNIFYFYFASTTLYRIIQIHKSNSDNCNTATACTHRIHRMCVAMSASCAPKMYRNRTARVALAHISTCLDRSFP